MARYAAVAGVRVEDLGSFWAAFSPASGQTHLINDESCALLDWLQGRPSGSSAEAADALAEEAGLPAAELLDHIDRGWAPLLTAALVRQVRDAGYPPPP